MKIVKFLVSPVLSLFGGGGGSKTTPQAQVQPAPLPTPMRDDAEAAARKQQDLLRRRGGAADMVTGAYGASAPSGGKTTLGS